MFDLSLGLIALSLVSLIGFAIPAQLPLRSSKRQGLLFMVVVLLAMALYAIFLRDSVFLAWCLPYSNLIVVGNWFPIGMALLAGLAWRHSSGPRWRRAWPVGELALAGSFRAVQPLLGKPPECVEHWDADKACG